MLEGFTETEIDEVVDALRRRELSIERPHQLPWSTLSGFSDRICLSNALARSWPVFPRTGDFLALQKLFRWPTSAMLNLTLVRAIPWDELST